MRRRKFISLLGGAAAWPLVVPLPAEAAQKLPRLCLVTFDPGTLQTNRFGAFFNRLRDLGYVDGKTIAIDYLSADGHGERFSGLAEECLRRGADVIAVSTTPAAKAAKAGTSTVSIVMLGLIDPTGSGLVASLARPGGNITGVTFVYDQLAGKLLELLKEAAPGVSRVAILWNPEHADPEFSGTVRAAQALDVGLLSLPVRDVGDFDRAFQSALESRSQALIVVWSRVVTLHRERIADFARSNGVLLVSNVRFWIELGGLLTYGPDVAELVARCADYVDKILKGAHPRDLPMQQPTSFKLAINATVARQHGLRLAPALLARADDVVE